MLIENCKLSDTDLHTELTEAPTKLLNGHSANSGGDLMPWTDLG
jgi:transposase